MLTTPWKFRGVSVERVDVRRLSAEIVALYREVIAEYKQTAVQDAEAEGRAAAAYLRQLAPLLARERDTLANSATFRLRNLLLRIPFAEALARSLGHRIPN